MPTLKNSFSVDLQNYSYRVFLPHTNTHHYACKVKGITLDFANSQRVNFDVMKTLITNIRERCDDEDTITVVYPKKITRKRRLDIVSERLKKIRGGVLRNVD